MSFSFTPQQQQPSTLFQSQQQQGSTFSLFPQTPQQHPQPQPSPLQFQPQPSPLQFQPQPQLQLQPQPQSQLQSQQQLFLFTNDKTSATYSTKWADLHPDSQKFLLQIEERILEYRDESQWLDQCSRLYDSSVFNGGFELDASRISQELGGISTAMERERAICQELMSVVKDMLRNTEVAVRSFMMLRPRFLHSNVGAATNATAPLQPTTVAQGSSNQAAATSIVPVFDFYSGLPRKPSPFLQQTVARFEKYIAECRQWIEELEQLLLLDADRNSLSSSWALLQSLPKVMANVHDFFVHVTAKVESIHLYIESMKTAYLDDQRRRGDGNNPFLEADRRETAKQEAAARRVHPTLHLPAVSQPSTQAAGAFSSSAMAGALTAPPISTAISSASSGSGFSLFSTPSSAAPSSSSIFSTPTTSAPLFGPSGPSPQSSPFGSLSASTPVVSGAASLFGPTSSTVSPFSAPFSSGGMTGSGQSFNTVSKTRAKSRTGRR